MHRRDDQRRPGCRHDRRDRHDLPGDPRDRRHDRRGRRGHGRRQERPDHGWSAHRAGRNSASASSPGSDGASPERHRDAGREHRDHRDRRAVEDHPDGPRPDADCGPCPSPGRRRTGCCPDAEHRRRCYAAAGPGSHRAGRRWIPDGAAEPTGVRSARDDPSVRPVVPSTPERGTQERRAMPGGIVPDGPAPVATAPDEPENDRSGAADSGRRDAVRPVPAGSVADSGPAREPARRHSAAGGGTASLRYSARVSPARWRCRCSWCRCLPRRYWWCRCSPRRRSPRRCPMDHHCGRWSEPRAPTWRAKRRWWQQRWAQQGTAAEPCGLVWPDSRRRTFPSAGARPAPRRWRKPI